MKNNYKFVIVRFIYLSTDLSIDALIDALIDASIDPSTNTLFQFVHSFRFGLIFKAIVVVAFVDIVDHGGH